MPKLRWLPSAQVDLVGILEFVAVQSGRVEIGLRLVGDLREKCRELSGMPATMGRPRPELRADIRSFAYKGYVIFFRYVDGVFEVVNIVHGRRDIDAMFGDDSLSAFVRVAVSRRASLTNLPRIPHRTTKPVAF